MDKTIDCPGYEHLEEWMNRRLEQLSGHDLHVLMIEDIREELLLAIEHPGKFVLYEVERHLHPDPELVLRTHSLRWKVIRTFDDAMSAGEAYVEYPESDKLAMRYASYLDAPGDVIDIGETY